MKVNIGTRGISMSKLAQICGGMLCCIGGESDAELDEKAMEEYIAARKSK